MHVRYGSVFVPMSCSMLGLSSVHSVYGSAAEEGVMVTAGRTKGQM